MVWGRRSTIAVVAIAAVLAVAFGVWKAWPLIAPAFNTATPALQETPIEPAPELPVYGPEKSAVWAWTDIPWRLLTFTPPAGHWVYFSEWNREFLVIPGKPLPVGAPAPDEGLLYEQAVALMHEINFDETTFKSWDDMEFSMAEFACARGTSEEDYELCRREPGGIVAGTTPTGLPYRSFTYPRIAYATKQPIGTSAFTVVRLGANGTFAMLLYAVNDAAGRAPMRSLAQSLTRIVEDAASVNQ